MFFKLNNNCFLIKGENQGGIYNLSKHNIYSLDANQQCFIEKLESGKSISSIESEEIDMDLLNKLTEENYGKMYKTNVFIDKLRFGTPENVLISRITPTIVNSIFLQISNECHMDCIHCKDDNQINRKTGCKKWTSNSSSITLDDYKNFIDKAVDLKCENVYIMGGDPLSKKELLIGLIKYTKTITSIKNVFIYTNLYLLDDEILENITTEKFIIHALGHTDELLHSLNNSKNSIEQLNNNIEKLRIRNIPYFFNLLLCKESYKYADQIYAYYSTKGSSGIFMDFVHNFNDDEFLSYILKYEAKELCSSVNEIEFFNNIKNHPCLNGKLSIFLDGDISICPMMKKKSIGNIKENSISYMLENNFHREYWDKTLSNIESCKKCSYRFACSDCRAIETSLNELSDSKQLCCKKYI